MPRMSKSKKLEWSFFLNDRGRKAFSTPTIEGTILRRNKADAGGKHPWKAEALEGDVTAATITNWYKEVYEPTYTMTPEKQG